MKQPLFSIITITFNSEKTIERTLTSVLNQTYKDYEYIIVDGASKDSTMDIVRKYESLFEGRMKWKSEPDKGIYDAMNKGILRSTGTLVGIVNSDDWLETDALENVHSAFLQNKENTRAIYCGGINYVAPKYTKIWPADIERFKKHAKKCYMAGIRHPATFVPLDVYLEIGMFDASIRIAADQDFILRCYNGNIEFVEVPSIVSNMSDGGVSTRVSSKARKQNFADKKVILNKNKLSKSRYWYLYFTWMLRTYLRDMLVLLGLYR